MLIVDAGIGHRNDLAATVERKRLAGRVADPEQLARAIVEQLGRDIFLAALHGRQVGHRRVAGNQRPDHVTIARFRRDNDAVMDDLFDRVAP